MGKPVLMGRRTLQSIGRPLLGRPSLILTRDRNLETPGVWVFCEPTVFLAAGAAMARNAGVDEVCVIGGADIFALALPIADRLVLSEVDTAPDGDVVFPAFKEADFHEVKATAFKAGAHDQFAFCVRELHRRQ